jgi:hypothetical protein
MSVSSIIDKTTGKIYDNLIPQGGGINLQKGQIITATNTQEVAFPDLPPADGTILSYDSNEPTGLKYIAVPGAVPIDYQELISANPANQPTIVPAPAQNNFVLTSDNTLGPASAGMAWKPPTGAGGLLSANLPLFDDATTTPNTIGIDFTAVKGEIPAGTGGARVGALIPPPAHDGYVLRGDAGEATGLAWTAVTETFTAQTPLLVDEPTPGDPTISIAFTAVKGEIPAGTGASSIGSLVPAPTVDNYVLTSASAELTGLKWLPLAGPSGSITTIAPLQDLENPPNSGVNELSIAYTAKGDLPVGVSAKTGEILPIGTIDGQVLEVFANAPTGMRWATPPAPSGGPTINRTNSATQAVLPPQSLNETMILVAETPLASWSAIASQGGDPAGSYQIEFTTPFYNNFLNPGAQLSGLQGIVEIVNGQRCINLFLTNQGGGGGGLNLGLLVFEDYNAPARVLGFCGPTGAGTNLDNSITIVGAFTKLISKNGPELFCSNILTVNLTNQLAIVAENLPSPAFGTALGLSGLGASGYCSKVFQPAGIPNELWIFGAFSLILTQGASPIPSGGFFSMIVYDLAGGNYQNATFCLTAQFGAKLSGGPALINDAFYDGAGKLAIVGEFDQLCLDAGGTTFPVPVNSTGVAVWELSLTPGANLWVNTPTGTPNAFTNGICCRSIVSQGANGVMLCGNSGIPVFLNMSSRTTTNATGTYPSPVIPFGFNCIVSGTTDIGAGQLPYDFILYQDDTNLECFCYYFSTANGTLGTILPPTPTGFIPDTTGGEIANCGIYLFFDTDPLVPVNQLQVGAKDSIYRYSSNTQVSMSFTLGTPASPLPPGFYFDGVLYHTATFTATNGGHESQSYIANQGKNAWVQIGGKTNGLTYT